MDTGGLANEFPDSAPPNYGWREAKHRQSSRRICVEHANAEHRQWRPLQRYTGRRETVKPTVPSTPWSPTVRAARRPSRCNELVHGCG